ncbi:MAG TPA: hypothetical protein VGN17_20515 [Bryobacteraceae bacterium]|jgi:hypothetical protein
MSFFALLKKQSVIVLMVALWIPAVGSGINVLWKYSTTPGKAATPPAQWPGDAPVARADGRATLVMFAHPQCPCTSASVGELAIIMAHHSSGLDADVYFYAPKNKPEGWVKNDLWKMAAAIPGVRVFEDHEAAAAQSFGAFTSGQVLLYDSQGSLEFNGGITAFRGHSGDNAGRTVITSLLQDGAPRRNDLPVRTPVLGCSLRGE